DVELCHPVSADRLDRETRANGKARRNTRQLDDEEEGSPVADPARGDQRADHVVWIAPQIMQQGRKQVQAREVQRAHYEGDEDAHRKIAVEQQARVEEWFVRGQAVDGEDPKRKRADDSAQDDLAGIEPIEALAAVEDQLRREDGDGEGKKADPVEVQWLAL